MERPGILAEFFADGPALLLTALVFLATAVLTFSIMLGLRARAAIKRRAAGIAEYSGDMEDARSLGASGLKAVQRLLDYVTKHYGVSENDKGEMKLLRRRMIHQAMNGGRQRVVAVRSHAIRFKHARGCLFTGFLYLAPDDVSRVADRSSACRHFLDHDGIRSDLGALSHREATQDLRTGADDCTAPQRWMPFGAFAQRRAAEGDSLINRSFVAHFGGFADHDAESVINEYPPANGRARVNFYPGEYPRKIRSETSDPLEAMRPAPMRDAVQHDRMQSGIAGQHLPCRTGGGIALHDIGNIFPQSAEHSMSPNRC